ncbi:hypothetical protein KJ708_04565 [bacterium]|nr:hypothetical protein [bacterium]MBU1917819.1 hypothetical protein [bacterium]
MDQRKIILIILLAAAIIYMFVSCGGSSTGSNNNDTGGVNTITSVDDIPLSVVDPSEYDVSMVDASFNALQYVEKDGEAIFSRAGCEADQQRNRIIREAKFPKMMLCYMQKMADGMGMEMGADDYNYYKLDGMDEGPEKDGKSMEMRIAIKKTDNTITMLMCENETKVMEFLITASDTYKGHIIDKWTFEEYMIDVDSKMLKKTETPQMITESRHLKFDADGDPDNFTTAMFTQAYDSSLWGFGEETLVATPDYATVYGYFNDKFDGNNFTGSSYARFDATQGTATYSVSGSYPAENVGDIADIDEDWYIWLTEAEPNGLGLSDTDYICCDKDSCEEVAAGKSCSFTDSGTESFAIVGTPPNEMFNLSDTDSAYAAFVDAAKLPETDTAPSIDFTSSDFSDCTATTWSELSGTPKDVDMSECNAIEEALKEFYNEKGREELKQIEDQKEKIEEMK